MQKLATTSQLQRVVFCFISLEFLFGAFEDRAISLGLKELRGWNNLKVQHGILSNGLIFGFLGECSNCCITILHSEDRRNN